MEVANANARPAITSADHSAYIFIATALCLVCMMLFLSVRLVVRYPWARSFGLDDWATLSVSVGLNIQRISKGADCLGMCFVPEYRCTFECENWAWKGRVRAVVLPDTDSSKSI